MKTPEEIKELINNKYNEIANHSKEKKEKFCGRSFCCSSTDHFIFSEEYSVVEGYYSEADLGLGYGIPTQFAFIQIGHTVMDLISSTTQKLEYLELIKKASFQNISIKKEKQIQIPHPHDIYSKYLSKEEIVNLKVLSITVYAEKLATKNCRTSLTCCY